MNMCTIIVGNRRLGEELEKGIIISTWDISLCEWDMESSDGCEFVRTVDVNAIKSQARRSWSVECEN